MLYLYLGTVPKDEGAGTLLGMYRLLGEYLFSSSRWEEFQSIIR